MLHREASQNASRGIPSTEVKVFEEEDRLQHSQLFRDSDTSVLPRAVSEGGLQGNDRKRKESASYFLSGQALNYSFDLFCGYSSH